MKKILNFIFFFYLTLGVSNNVLGNDNFFNKGLELYKNKKYNDARFMFERSIVFNPKNSNAYLYLAKIYNVEQDQKKEEKNLETTLLIEPDNEEAILMSRKYRAKK